MAIQVKIPRVRKEYVADPQLNQAQGLLRGKAETGVFGAMGPQLARCGLTRLLPIAYF